MKENQIKGIMTELLETKDKKSAFQVFLDSEKLNLNLMKCESEIAKTRSSTLSEYYKNKIEYKEIIEDPNNIELFNRMKLLETKMVQARCLIDTNVKLSMINQKRSGSETSYIIARAPFYNPDNVKAEIRVYLGKAEEINRNIEDLSRDAKFMEDAEKQIVKAMIEVMDKIKLPVKASIKKSVKVNQLVSADGEELSEYEETIVESKKMKSPFKPGIKPNPKPKHYGIFPPEKK